MCKIKIYTSTIIVKRGIYNFRWTWIIYNYTFKIIWKNTIRNMRIICFYIQAFSFKYLIINIIPTLMQLRIPHFKFRTFPYPETKSMRSIGIVTCDVWALSDIHRTPTSNLNMISPVFSTIHLQSHISEGQIPSIFYSYIAV